MPRTRSPGIGIFFIVNGRPWLRDPKQSTNIAAMRKADILKQRGFHRGDPREFVLGFLLNYSSPARLMHSLLPPTKDKEDILQAAMRAYSIGIAACVETFFRDLFFYLLERNPRLLQRALNEGNRKESASRLPLYIAEGVSAEEFAAHQA